MKRRDFLKTGGIAGTAGLIFDGCGKPQQLIPLLVSEDQFVPGEEGWVRTLCQQCAAGCGITVRVMQGESIRTIDGQQRSPLALPVFSTLPAFLTAAPGGTNVNVANNGTRTLAPAMRLTTDMSWATVGFTLSFPDFRRQARVF